MHPAKKTAVSTRNPSYLYRKPYSYGVRLRLPRDLAPCFPNKAEIKLSLRTTNIREARERARLIVSHMQWIFRNIRAGGILAELTEAEMDRLIKDYTRELLNDNLNLWLGQGPLKGDDDVEHRTFFFQQLKLRAQDQLRRLDFKGEHDGSWGEVNACSNVDAMLAGVGLDVDPGSLEYSKLCLRMLKGLCNLYGELQSKALNGIISFDGEVNGDQRTNLQDTTMAVQGVAIAQGQDSNQETVTIGQAARAYWKERSENWKPRSKRTYQAAFNYFIEYFGDDTPVDQIDFYRMKDFRDSLRDTKTLSVSRTNFYLDFVKAIFNLEMKTTRILKVNPAEGLNLKDKRKRQDQRSAFDLNDLEMMFIKSREYGNNRHPHDYTFWLPLLGLFTGAREEELAQLRTWDIIEHKGISCIDINENDEQKSVKTTEQRLIPVHPFLLELGFVRYARKVPKGMLWKSIKRQSGRWSHYFSRWFKTFKDRAGIDPTPGKLVFHSFRHTVASNLKAKGVEEIYISELLGHSVNGETFGRYGKQFEPHRLFDKAVSKLDFHEKLDLSHLKGNRWARPRR
jgi:integrase